MSALLGLAMLSACMGGPSGVVLSEGPEIHDDPGGGVTFPGDDETPVQSGSFAMVLNDLRRDGGVAEVQADSRLNSAAFAHAQDMEAFGYVSHIDRNGGRAGDRALAAGYDWNFIAENIARGFETTDGVMDAWMASPAHRENILDDRAEDFGLGRVDDTWVLLLAREFPAVEIETAAP